MPAPEHSFAGARAASFAAAERAVVVTDRAGSVWRRVAGRPDHPARFRSADRFLPDGGTSAARGGWWELAPDVQIVTPAMFGCGPAVADNAPGLSDFYAYVETFGCTASQEGRYPVQGNVVMGRGGDGDDGADGGGVAERRSTLLGRLRLEATAPIDGAVLTNRMRRGARIGGLAVAGGGSPVYADKLFDIGLLVEAPARRQAVGHVEIADARLFGVFLRGGGPGLEFGTASIHGCGSGCADAAGSPAPAGAFLQANYSRLTRGGSAGAYYQTTCFQLKPGSPLPPPAIEAHGMLSFVRIGGEEYPVACFDRSSNRVTVWGWVPPGTPTAGGTIAFVFGGGWGSAGGGAGARFGHLAVTASAIGRQKGSADEAEAAVTMRRNYIGQTVGTSPGGATAGGATFGRFEGNNADLWLLGRPASNDSGYRVVPPLDPAGIRRHGGDGGDGGDGGRGGRADLV